MAPPQRDKFATSENRYLWVQTDDGSRTLEDQELGETFHSGCGAATESWEVYLTNSGVLERLQTGMRTQVVEFGFGTGTAFLLTAAAATQAKSCLGYCAVENNLLPLDILGGLPLATTLAGLSASGLGWLPSRVEPLQQRLVELLGTVERPGEGQLDIQLSEFVSLRLCLGAAEDQTTASLLPRRAPPWSARANAIYFDPFSPASNPNMWQPPMLEKAYELLEEGGTLTSYCVKGSIRRMLSEIGFSVTKLPGPLNGKREVLLARK